MLLPLLEPLELFLLLNFFVLFSVLQFLFFRTTERFVHMSYVFVISQSNCKEDRKEKICSQYCCAG